MSTSIGRKYPTFLDTVSAMPNRPSSQCLTKEINSTLTLSLSDEDAA